MPNFSDVTFKMSAYTPKTAEIGVFWYKFSQKGYIPFIDFYQIRLGEAISRSTLSRQISSLSLKKCVQPQNRENGIFWYKFDPKGKLWRSTEKVEYRNTTTNLSLCNDTITVLKITLLHSASVITKFLIPKTPKNRTLFRLQPARDLRSPPYSAW